MEISDLRTIKQDLRTLIDVLYQNTSIGRKNYNLLLGKRDIDKIAKLIQKNKDVKFKEFKLSLFNLRDLNGKPSWSVIPIFDLPQTQKLRGKKLKSSGQHFYSCFVGHRFVKKVTNNLRHNLAPLMEAYNIKPVYVDVENATGIMFDNIIDDIEEADFCFFDTRETKNRPNVFIEVGITYAKRKPFFFCEHVNNRLTKGDIPSDLAGLQRVSYKEYRELCQKLSILLPVFLKKHFMKEMRLG